MTVAYIQIGFILEMFCLPDVQILSMLDISKWEIQDFSKGGQNSKRARETICPHWKNAKKSPGGGGGLDSHFMVRITHDDLFTILND